MNATDRLEWNQLLNSKGYHIYYEKIDKPFTQKKKTIHDGYEVEILLKEFNLEPKETYIFNVYGFSDKWEVNVLKDEIIYIMK